MTLLADKPEVSKLDLMTAVPDALREYAVALAGRIGKIPVLVKDAPGFLVNRVLIPYLAEALVILSRGLQLLSEDG